ncbi:hypothetical protein [Spirulina major]|uniref:hypothetical protein n=1 Tax=Spirulina major TaxID=270636 RepID=UPI0009353077|nr:hypothetical protein [Spirulina major]
MTVWKSGDQDGGQPGAAHYAAGMAVYFLGDLSLRSHLLIPTIHEIPSVPRGSGFKKKAAIVAFF